MFALYFYINRVINKSILVNLFKNIGISNNVFDCVSAHVQKRHTTHLTRLGSSHIGT